MDEGPGPVSTVATTTDHSENNAEALELIASNEREISGDQIANDNVLEDDEIDYMNHLLLLQQLQQNEYTRHHLMPDQASLLSAADDFNNGVVLTRRPLRPNELFQVRLERVVTKWAGSVEMGVTTHSADELDFPFTMTNVR